MEIVLVQQKSPEPKEADMLAQASLEGGGDVEEQMNPAAPMPAPFPDPEPEITMPQPTESEPPQPPESATTEAVVAKPEPVKKDVIEKLTVEDTESPNPIVEKVETPSEEKQITETKETKTDEKIETQEQQENPVKEVIKKIITPTAAQLLTNSFKIASLSAEIRRKTEARAKRPRRKFISASTKEYKYAAYMEAWRAKVERIGNLNYPEQARRKGLSGSLVLDVAVRRDGSIDEITIRRSSGEKMLDDAAIRIVELSAPFSPFPQHIKDETDILHIMRTWQFLNKRGFK
ncbi:MAG TPA: energy transducer TonB [Thiotrichaceae bacterium]|nr:energy transducer TonB [Thiotrichaceae bacterium]HIM07130.1 energy transducer TonB [Gammaproteobacteria bacterium]